MSTEKTTRKLNFNHNFEVDPGRTLNELMEIKLQRTEIANKVEDCFKKKPGSLDHVAVTLAEIEQDDINKGGEEEPKPNQVRELKTLTLELYLN